MSEKCKGSDLLNSLSCVSEDGYHNIFFIISSLKHEEKQQLFLGNMKKDRTQPSNCTTKICTSPWQESQLFRHFFFLALSFGNSFSLTFFYERKRPKRKEDHKEMKIHI